MVILLASCSGSPPDDPAVARASAAETVRAFLGAVASADSSLLREIAPGLELDDQRISDLQTVLSDLAVDVDPAEVTLDGSSAIAVLAVGSSTDGSASRILVPLEWSRDRWVIGSRITVEQRLDVVPLRDPQ